MAEQINVNEFKPGVTFLRDNEVYIVLESSHSKSGRGQAHVKCKTRNMFTGTNSTITFTGGDRVEKAYITKSTMQFLYSNGSNAFFMNVETFEQIELATKNLKEELKFITDGSEVLIISYGLKILGVEIPKNVELIVSETADAVRGDTVNNATKKAILETGLEVDVPQFIDQDQKIIINTTTGKYGGKA